MVLSNTKSSHSEQKTDPDFASVPELCKFGKNQQMKTVVAKTRTKRMPRLFQVVCDVTI
jgi:hypothetical protein